MVGAGDGPDGYRTRTDGPKPRDRGPGAGGSARTEPYSHGESVFSLKTHLHCHDILQLNVQFAKTGQ